MNSTNNQSINNHLTLNINNLPDIIVCREPNIETFFQRLNITEADRPFQIIEVVTIEVADDGREE
jgi:hypothetical protein